MEDTSQREFKRRRAVVIGDCLTSVAPTTLSFKLGFKVLSAVSPKPDLKASGVGAVGH